MMNQNSLDVMYCCLPVLLHNMFPHNWPSSGVKDDDDDVNASICFISSYGFAIQFSLGMNFQVTIEMEGTK
jgi:hypothetical protein